MSWPIHDKNNRRASDHALVWLALVCSLWRSRVPGPQPALKGMGEFGFPPSMARAPKGDWAKASQPMAPSHVNGPAGNGPCVSPGDLDLGGQARPRSLFPSFPPLTVCDFLSLFSFRFFQFSRRWLVFSPLPQFSRVARHSFQPPAAGRFRNPASWGVVGFCCSISRGVVAGKRPPSSNTPGGVGFIPSLEGECAPLRCAGRDARSGLCLHLFLFPSFKNFVIRGHEKLTVKVKKRPRKYKLPACPPPTTPPTPHPPTPDPSLDSHKKNVFQKPTLF